MITNSQELLMNLVRNMRSYYTLEIIAKPPTGQWLEHTLHLLILAVCRPFLNSLWPSDAYMRQ